MSLLPTGLLERWRTRARRGALMKLKSLLEFRELIDEYRAEGVLMQAYKEASEAMLISTDTLRRHMWIIREYPEERLIFWIQNGVSFDHIENSNTLQEYAHRDATQLLDEAVELGNEEGKPMTVSELVTHALGEEAKPSILFRVNRWFERSVKFSQLMQWDEDKKSRWQNWIEQGKEFFR